jgi:hypothetical protein
MRPPTHRVDLGCHPGGRTVMLYCIADLCIDALADESSGARLSEIVGVH